MMKILSTRIKDNVVRSLILVDMEIIKKTNISYASIRTLTCANRTVRNVSFSKNFAEVLNK